MFGIFCVAQLSACGNVADNGCYVSGFCGTQEAVNTSEEQPAVEKTPPTTITLNPMTPVVNMTPSHMVAVENTNQAHLTLVDTSTIVSQWTNQAEKISAQNVSAERSPSQEQDQWVSAPYASAQREASQEQEQVVSVPYATATYDPDNH